MSDTPLALLPRWVVPVVPEGTVLEHHAVVLEAGRIVDVLPADELDRCWPGIKARRMPGHALIPGLVNAHTHSAMTLLRGLADDLPLRRWLAEHIWPAEGRWVGPEYCRDGMNLALVEMLRGGTTCFNDNYFFPDITAATTQKAGMRAVIGLPVISVPTAWAETEDEYFSKGLEVHQSLRGLELVTTAFAPHAPYTVTDEGFARMARLADEMDIPVHLHLLEAAGEIEESEQRFGHRPLIRLKRLGLLTSRLLAVHMTQLDVADMDLVARHGVHVLHCPESNLKLASGICPVAGLMERGVNVALGTDGAASNNDLDMFGEMRTAGLLAKLDTGDPEALPAARLLSMATIHGARALGLEEEIGSIEPGKAADLVAIDLDAPETQPVHHVISTLVYAASRFQITDVWVAGRPVLTDREPATLDVAEITERARIWRRRLADLT